MVRIIGMIFATLLLAACAAPTDTRERIEELSEPAEIITRKRSNELVNLPAGSKVYNANTSASKQQNDISMLIQELRDNRIDYNAFARVLRDQLLLVGG